MRGRRTFSVGASTSAVPDTTCAPSWFVQAQSKTTRFFSGFFSRAVTVAVMVSPRPTGARKRRSCDR